MGKWELGGDFKFHLTWSCKHTQFQEGPRDWSINKSRIIDSIDISSWWMEPWSCVRCLFQVCWEGRSCNWSHPWWVRPRFCRFWCSPSPLDCTWWRTYQGGHRAWRWGYIHASNPVQVSSKSCLHLPWTEPLCNHPKESQASLASLPIFTNNELLGHLKSIVTTEPTKGVLDKPTGLARPGQDKQFFHR
jgi:hypothetical protein